jgi:putative transposase
MRKSRFTEEQIVSALQLAKSAGEVSEICRKLGVTKTTFYRWKSKYGGMGVDDTRRLKQHEDENRRLKKIVADPRHADPQEGARKKMVRPTARREVVGHVRKKYQLSERRICKLLGFWRGTMRYQS